MINQCVFLRVSQAPWGDGMAGFWRQIHFCPRNQGCSDLGFVSANKLGLIVVFLGAEESSCRGEGAELSHNTWEYPDFPSSENNNWAAFCVFGLEQRVPFLIKGTVWICHPLHARCRVKLLEEWASDEH